VPMVPPVPMYPSAADLFDRSAARVMVPQATATEYRQPMRPNPPRSRRVLGVAIGIATVAAGVVAFIAVRGHNGAVAPAPRSASTSDATVVIGTISHDADGGTIDDSATAVAASDNAPPPLDAGTDAAPRVVHATPRGRVPATVAQPTATQSAPASAELASAMQNARYAAAAALCRADSRLVSVQPDSCVIAACNTHDRNSALYWLAQVRKHRAAVLDSCRLAGTPLDARSAGGSDNCADPFACQH